MVQVDKQKNSLAQEADVRKGSRLSYYLGAAIVAVMSIILFFHMRHATAGDPDRYIHFALARHAGPDFLVWQLPQVEDAGWKEGYPEKEFLFRALTAMAYRLSGEAGIYALICGLSVFIYSGIYALAASFLAPGAAALLTLGTTIGHSYFFYRLAMVRPHMLAVTLFVWLLVALVRGWRRRALVILCLFPLAYHSVQIAALPFFMWLFAQYWLGTKPRSKLLRQALYGLLALAIGIVANPFFPGNIEAMLLVIKATTGSTAINPENFGLEMQTQQADVFLRQSATVISMTVLAIAGMWARMHGRKQQQQSESALFLTAIALIFLVLATITPRAFEYGVPAVIGAFAAFTATQRRPLLWIAALMCLSLARIDYIQIIARGFASDRQAQAQLQSFKNILSLIPVSQPGAKVLNCDWSTGAYLLYFRPDLRFVDMLDPSFLGRRQPGLDLARNQLNNGQVPDAFTLARGLFQADYVLSGIATASSRRLAEDPHFERLDPKVLDNPLVPADLFRVTAGRFAEEVMAFHVRFLPQSDARAADPGDGEAAWPPPPTAVVSSSLQSTRDLTTDPNATNHLIGGQQAASTASAFIDLFQEFQRRHPNGRPSADQSLWQSSDAQLDPRLCAVVRPDAAALAALHGAEVAVLGGGPHLKLYRNDKLVFATTKPLTSISTTALHLPLMPPLTAHEDLRLEVCADRSRVFFGAALSLWKKSALIARCQAMRGGATSQADQNTAATWVHPSPLCLGAEAAPAE